MLSDIERHCFGPWFDGLYWYVLHIPQHAHSFCFGVVWSDSVVYAEPLSSSACKEDAKYMDILSASASLTAIFAFIFVPRFLDFLLTKCIICCARNCIKKATRGRLVYIILITGLVILFSLTIWMGAISESYFISMLLPEYQFLLVHLTHMFMLF
jgi:hypothetical protein